MKRFAQLILIAFTAASVGACSVVDLAYRKAPGYAVSELDDAFDLSDEQRRELEPRLQQFFAWHRAEELGRYQQMLDRAALAAADGITEDEFLTFNGDLRNAWRRALDKAIDSFGDLAATLTPEQIEHYRRYFRESSEEHQDYLDKSQQQREIFRVRYNLEQLEKWFGDFDEALEARVSARLQQLPELYEPWLRYREAQHEALLEVLGEASAADDTRRKLKYVMLDNSTDYAQAFDARSRGYWRAYAEALVEISSWLSESQRQKAISRLQNYARAASRLNSSG